MIAKDVKIGGEYLATVSGQRVVVKILSFNGYKGWNAENLTTKRVVRIKTAGRLTPVPAGLKSLKGPGYVMRDTREELEL